MILGYRVGSGPRSGLTTTPFFRYLHIILYLQVNYPTNITVTSLRDQPDSLSDLGLPPHLTSLMTVGKDSDHQSTTTNTAFSYSNDSGTDVMLLDDYSSDSTQHTRSIYSRRKSSVTFEDEVEQKCDVHPVPAEIGACDTTLESFASSLAKAIEMDAKISLFGEDAMQASSVLRSTPGNSNINKGSRNHVIPKQRLILQSIDEGNL
ncbi:G- coupled receptor 161 isoform X1 [Pelobates cultripes]|uniref:G- coupled receptor 161 isoform X1 n=1 Tax=Pelobates cultripes TaxID=61616 RepID=A0AAD1VMP1_PELCU|nr:G- coupled receptor 161 isoform X1 [Pelobates cultripes]